MMTFSTECDKINYENMLMEAFELIGKLSDEQLKTLIEQVREGKQ